MNKALQFGLSAVANFLPGLKTYVMLVTAGLMAVCEGFGFHTFDPAVWTTVGVTGATFWKMGQDRENPNHPVGTPGWARDRELRRPQAETSAFGNPGL